jgi:SAM-dependent methyltransferase
MPPEADPGYWEHPERVERFANREPDHRLMELAAAVPDPGATRALDLGCAGGRNTELLARLGFDTHALDASRAMVRRTRQRVAALLGPEEARVRVRQGRMDDLGRYGDGAFHLVVALGVHHTATSLAEWERAVDETARVLAPGGLLLFSQFSPDTDLTGAGVTAVAREPGLYRGLPGGPAVLLPAEAVDAAMARRELLPAEPTRTATTPLETGRRVSVNGLYRKAGWAGDVRP